MFSPLLLPDSVQGVYLRRSTAVGEAILGQSDIDLAVIINNFESAQQELPLVRRLSNMYRLYKCLCPVLGELFIFNQEDLKYWFKNKPFRGELSKYWLRLYGKFIYPEDVIIPKEDIIAEFCFWLFDMLPKFYMKRDLFGRNTRHCVVALLEMYNAFFTLEEPSRFPKPRKNDVLDYLIGKDGKYGVLRKPLNGVITNNTQGLKYWIYKDALELAEKVFYYSDEFLRDTIKEGELNSKSPPAFIPTKYVFKDGLPERGVHNVRIIPTTTKALKLYLGYWNPWEYYSLRKLNPLLRLSEPSEQAMKRYFAKNINRHLVRYPLIMNKDYSYYRNILLQTRLLNHYNIICKDEEELMSKYELCYGNWQGKEYQLLWDIATKINYGLKSFRNNSC